MNVLKLFLFFVLSAALTLAACSFFGCFETTDSLPSQTEPIKSKYKTVIIDAGHGGEDGGAVSASGLVEKNVNLEISKLL